MNRHLWELHAAVFELARAHGLRDFAVCYADTGEEVEISLAMSPATENPAARQPARAQSDSPC